jgi:hypothetical protein
MRFFITKQMGPKKGTKEVTQPEVVSFLKGYLGWHRVPTAKIMELSINCLTEPLVSPTTGDVLEALPGGVHV